VAAEKKAAERDNNNMVGRTRAGRIARVMASLARVGVDSEEAGVVLLACSAPATCATSFCS
jgi:hypothetical protein